MVVSAVARSLTIVMLEVGIQTGLNTSDGVFGLRTNRAHLTATGSWPSTGR